MPIPLFERRFQRPPHYQTEPAEHEERKVDATIDQIPYLVYVSINVTHHVPLCQNMMRPSHGTNITIKSIKVYCPLEHVEWTWSATTNEVTMEKHIIFLADIVWGQRKWGANSSSSHSHHSPLTFVFRSDSRFSTPVSHPPPSTLDWKQHLKTHWENNKKINYYCLCIRWSTLFMPVPFINSKITHVQIWGSQTPYFITLYIHNILPLEETFPLHLLASHHQLLS